MVKFAHFPGAVVMARLANCARLSFVFVVFFVTAETIGGGLAIASQIFVTRRALDLGLGMGITQAEFGLLVRKAPRCCLPISLAMAIGTLIPQRPNVLVVFFMATEAVCWRIPEHGVLVTVLALGIEVFTQQWKAALVMIKPGRLFPAPLTVAAHTIFTQRFLVFVVFAVARIAILTQFIPVNRTLVTCNTSGGHVLSAQLVFSVHVVIEGCRLPCLHTMASLTLLTVLAFVAFAAVVIFLVTADTLAGGVFVFVCLMAISALRIHMLALKGKLRGAVIKPRFFPVVFCMAISTLGAQ